MASDHDNPASPERPDIEPEQLPQVIFTLMPTGAVQVASNVDRASLWSIIGMGIEAVVVQTAEAVVRKKLGGIAPASLEDLNRLTRT